MRWPNVAIDHEKQAALKPCHSCITARDEVVFSAVIQQLEFILDEAEKEGERIKSEESQP